jgi:biotin operon repressor
MTYAERRAEILDLLEKRGSPRLLNGARLAERYDCTRQMIHKDLDRLAEWASDTQGDRETLEGEALYWRCIQGLLEDDEYRKAAQTLSDYHDWLRTNDLEDLLERIEALEREHEQQAANDYRVK